jgi:hypothetical protein
VVSRRERFSLSVELKPLPDPRGFSLQGYPTFLPDGIYVAANLLTKYIGLQVPSWPGWANDILGWVTGMLTTRFGRDQACDCLVARADSAISEFLSRYWTGVDTEHEHDTG